ncbi:uncharacterized protein LOC130799140 [Amaranthus tricolor]|uniref:uncharacterized protein LOC130799140 n=1 Tax=Amaranthus tricolor TaxID=29722 RepID=UPI00258C40DB|nr:uncharacterized protein LOC130799140 [Amaranthus tricolor]XP_057518209.1 uncharacterized protein LOC130799140 [Amaranthus tricolor]
MDSRSLAKPGFGDGNGRKISVESDFDEFHGCLPKSPMRDRFLNDLTSAPVSLSYDSPLPIRGRGPDDGDFDGVGISPDRLRNVSKSPVRERGGKSSMSVRTRNVSMSPLSGTDTVKRSTARTMHQDISNSSLREGFASKFDERMDKEQGDEVWRDRMTLKTSFHAWLSEDSRSRPSNGISLDRRRQKCRDGVSDEFDQISVGKVSVADEHGMTLEGSIDDAIHGGDSIRETTDRDFSFNEDYAERYRRPRVNAYQWSGGNYGNEVFLRNSRVPIESGMMSASSSSLYGPSSHYLDSIHACVHSRQSGDVRRGPADIHYMEHVELKHTYQEPIQRYPPKELNELDDDLFSSLGLYSEADEYSQDFGYRRGSTQQFLPDNYIPRCSYFNHGPGLDYELEKTFSPPPYDDPYEGQMHRSRQQHFSQYPMPDYVPGQSLNYDRDSFISYRTGVHVHHPIDMQGQDIPSFAYGMPPNSAVNPAGCMNLQRPDPRMYYPKMAHTGPREQTPHLPPRHTRRVQVANQNKRLSLPLLGGSPFVICHKCFELLKLPGNFMTNKKVYQLQCGRCSYIMSFDLRDGSFNVLTFQKKPDPVKCTGVCSESLNESDPTHHHDSCADTSISIESYDFEGNSFQSTESEAREASRRQILALNLDEHARAISPSSRSSKECLSESISVRSSRPNSSEFPFKIRPPTGSPSRELLDHSKQCIDASQDHSIAYTAATSETEVYSHDLSTRSSLLDSRDVPREYEDGSIDRPPYGKSFGSPSGRRSLGSGEVYVNGQQVPSHVVRKAEKLAGPILPGAYWYDPKAGFWGVMGHHCLGIIPPSIQEFSFPMPESCSRGDTTVYVNGRELQKMDLDLLASRGLPAIKGKRYIIDIFGKVLEEKNKDFIINLGKLAPTVVNTRKGYGMRVPMEFMP